MKILVCGGRDYADWYRLKTVLDDIYKKFSDITIISGCAKGADTLAIEWVVLNHVELELYYANWKEYRRKAGPIRNQKMLDEGKPDLVIAFPGGNGTADMVRRSKKANIPLMEMI